MNHSPELAFRHNSIVGEGPLWDERNKKLVWIDVLDGKVFLFDPRKVQNREFSIGKHVGAVALSNSDDILVAAKDEFLWLHPESSTTSPIHKAFDDERFRFNDGRVDARGRFIIGTMGYQPEPGTAALYSYVLPNKMETVINGVGLSNGLAWTADNRTLFYIDTLTSEISRFDYDIETTHATNRSTVIKFEQHHGSPDGMTIDIEGNLWVGFWGGGCIRRIAPSGHILDEFKLPVSRVTSASFGGDTRSQLFITSASYLLSERELKEEPLAGSLFVMDTDTQGLPEHRISS